MIIKINRSVQMERVTASLILKKLALIHGNSLAVDYEKSDV